MNNQLKSKTRLAFIQYIFLSISSHDDNSDIKNDFDNYFHNLTVAAIDETKDYELWCINAHATSTPKGDAAEMTAVNKFLSDLESNTSDKITFPKEGVHVTSHKGNFGHLMGAAGSVESAFAVLSLSKRILPPTINLENAGDLEVNGKTRIVRDVIDDSHCKSTSKKLILKNSFGFGGTNVSLLFGEYLS